MNDILNRLPTDRRRSGFTLVEVVAGMALLAVLLVGVASATSSHKRSLQRSADRLEAIAIADQLLASLPGRDGRYAIATGVVPGHADWAWSLAPTGMQRLDGLIVETLRLEIIDTVPKRASLVTVDLVQGRLEARP